MTRQSPLQQSEMPPVPANENVSGALGGLSQPRRAAAVATVLASMSLVVLDAGMVNVALPTIANELAVTPATSILTVTAYQTALVMALLPLAALGEGFGYRRVFAGGVATFTVASGLCAFAPSLPWLLAARCLQGLGGAAIMALGVALLRFAVPASRLGAAIGWNALTVALSSAASPAMGALILGYMGWQWLFLVNLPLGAAALFAARALPAVSGTGKRMDRVSVCLNGLAFASLVVGAEWIPRAPLEAILLLPAGTSAFAALVRREAPKTAPMIPLDLLGSHAFRISVAASICCFAGQTAALVALPFHLQHGLGLTPAMTGLYLTPWPLSAAVTATIAGRLADRVSTAWLSALGAIALAAGLAATALWPLHDNPAAIVALTAMCGAGFGLFQVSNNRNMFFAAPRERSGAAGGMQGTARLTGQTAGAMLMTLLFTTIGTDGAPNAGLAAGAALTLAAGLVSIFRANASVTPVKGTAS